MYTLPVGYAQPLFLAFDGQGRLWFTMPMDDSIGMYNPGNNTFQQWTVPTANAGPWDIAIDHNGKLWFTEFYSNKIGRFDPNTQTFMEVPTPASNSYPYGIVVDGSNNVWFTENNSTVALIGEYTSGGQLDEYKIRYSLPSNLTPHLITVDPNGNIWWSEGWVGMIAELKVARHHLERTMRDRIRLSERMRYMYVAYSGTSVDSNGLVWFNDVVRGDLWIFPDSGTGFSRPYSASSANSHPHDGLIVDGQNRIWLSEEFSNKLAVAI